MINGCLAHVIDWRGSEAAEITAHLSRPSRGRGQLRHLRFSAIPSTRCCYSSLSAQSGQLVAVFSEKAV